jgi:hypothetical protein
LITTLDLRRIKVGYDHVTFLGPEATLAICDYLRWRNEKHVDGDSDLFFEKRRVYSNEDYLFIRERISDSFLTTMDDRKRQVSRKGVIRFYRGLARESGHCVEGKGDWQYLRSHNMRKHFNITMRNAGADGDLVEYFMGHNVGSVKTAYFRGIPDKLKLLYMKYVPFLSFADTEVRTIESAEYRELRDENTQMKSEMEAMKDKFSKVESFESHLNELVADHMDELVHAKVKEMLKNVTEEDIQELT